MFSGILSNIITWFDQTFDSVAAIFGLLGVSLVGLLGASLFVSFVYRRIFRPFF